MFYFLLLVSISNLALEAVATGKRYYRQAVLTKTLVERELGLFGRLADFEDESFNLAVATTPGMRDLQSILFDHKIRIEKPIRKGTIVDHLRMTFWALIAIEIAGSFFSAVDVILKLNGL